MLEKIDLYDSHPLVSVIIPVFNVRNYLTEALESVINQTYKKLEIILIDDGSNDGSERICDDYANRYTSIQVVHQKNRGLSAARNTGLDIMKGDMVTFLDADDALDHNCIKSMLDTMIHEKSDIVVCKYLSFITSGKMTQTGKEEILPQTPEGRYNRMEALESLANGRINVSVWNKMYRRKLWGNIRFPEGRVYEDLVTTFMIVDLSNSVYVLDKILYFGRIRAGSITTTFSWKQSIDHLVAWSELSLFTRLHIPKISISGDMIKHYQSTLDRILIDYIKNPEAAYKNCREYDIDPRQFIIDKSREIKIQRKKRTILACWMLSSFPNLLRGIYCVFYQRIK